MSAICPNCSTEFAEHRETAYRCESCESWFTNVDGDWHECPEPAKPAEPSPPEPPKPKEPTLSGPVKEKNGNSLTDDRPAVKPNVRSKLGGLITITEIEDDPDNDEEN